MLRPCLSGRGAPDCPPVDAQHPAGAGHLNAACHPGAQAEQQGRDAGSLPASPLRLWRRGAGACAAVRPHTGCPGFGCPAHSSPPPAPSPTRDGPPQNGKPAPDCFMAVAHRLGLPPSACLVIEDAPAGVAAATAAGMRVVAVPSILQKGGQPSDMYPAPDPAAAAGCVSILPSLLEFRPEQYGLPPFEGGWQGVAGLLRVAGGATGVARALPRPQQVGTDS